MHLAVDTHMSFNTSDRCYFQLIVYSRRKIGAREEATRRGRRNRNFVLDWGLGGQPNGDEQHDQVAHERLREGEGVTTTPRKTKRPRRLVRAARMTLARGRVRV